VVKLSSPANQLDGRLVEAIRACLDNGRRLLDEVQFLELNEPPATAYYLSVIAQEEFAKGFLLALVVRGVIPWDRRLLRAARDHSCKQLLCVVMDYVNPDLETFIERCNAVVLRHELRQVPLKVADAINILRHEKIGRWVRQSWVWAEDPDYHPEALAVSEGEQDRLKQDALYVRLAADGGVASIPTDFNLEMVRGERERAGRLARLTEGTLSGESRPGLDYKNVEELFRELFASTGDSQDGS